MLDKISIKGRDMKLTTILSTVIALGVCSFGGGVLAQSDNDNLSLNETSADMAVSSGCWGLNCAGAPGAPGAPADWTTTVPSPGQTDWLNNQNDFIDSNQFHPQRGNEMMCLSHCWTHARASRALCMKAQGVEGQGNPDNAADALQRARLIHINKICDKYEDKVFNTCTVRDKCF